jgi:hypothetical protein
VIRRRLDRDLACELWLSGQFRCVTDLARHMDFSRQAVADALAIRGLTGTRRRIRYKGRLVPSLSAEIKTDRSRGDAFFQQRLEEVYGSR